MTTKAFAWLLIKKVQVLESALKKQWINLKAKGINLRKNVLNSKLVDKIQTNLIDKIQYCDPSLQLHAVTVFPPELRKMK